MAHTPARTDTAAMCMPVRTMASKEAPEVPSLSISATRVGINRAPATSTISRTTVIKHSFQWGFRKRRIKFISVPLLYAGTNAV